MKNHSGELLSKPINRRSALQLMGISGLGAAALVTSQPTIAKASTGEVANITDYGAIPDPNVDNRPAIQAAIDALPATGGTILIPAGVWGVSFTDHDGIYVDSNVSVTGIGPASELFVNQQTSRRTHVFRNRDWDTGVENSRLAHLTVNCNGMGQNFSGNSWEINGATFRRSSHCSIDSIRVLDGRGYGIWLVESESCSITGSYVRNFSDGIELSNNSIHNIISNNIVEADGNYSWVSSGIIAYGNARRNTFTGNIVRGGYGQGISTVSGYGHGNENTFIGNVVDVYNTVGFAIGGDRNLVKGNHINTFLQPGIWFDDRYGPSHGTVIDGNIINADLRWASATRKSAVLLQPEVQQTAVSGNHITVQGGEAVRLLGNQISVTGNQIDADATSNGVCGSSVGALISMNHISAKNCICLEGGSEIQLSNNLLNAFESEIFDPQGISLLSSAQSDRRDPKKKKRCRKRKRRCRQ